LDSDEIFKVIQKVVQCSLAFAGKEGAARITKDLGLSVDEA
jgi:hypothetical protein